jgi:glycosyltransferase involved in cell wall biosynthesis
MGLSGVQRTQKFAKFLPEFAWKPLVLTTDSKDFYAYDNTLLSEFEGREIEIFRTKDHNPNKKSKKIKIPSWTKQKIGRYIFGWIFFPDRFIKWKKPAEILAKKIIKENAPDVILATAPPFTDFLLAQELATNHDIPFVVDYRDTWTGNEFHYFPTPLHKNKARKLEERILSQAEKIIVISRNAKELLLKRYQFLTHEDIQIIPHGYDQEDFLAHPGAKPDPNIMTITHSGMFQDNRSPKYFMRALSEFLKEYPNARGKIRLRLVGAMRKSHIRLIKKFKLEDSVSPVGNVSHSQAVKYLLESDVLWLMLADKIRTPGKLYEYFGARKTLLITSPDGNMKDLAKKSRAAFSTNYDDNQAIKENIASLFKLWQGGALPRPNEEFVSGYERRKLTEELAKTLSGAIHISQE